MHFIELGLTFADFTNKCEDIPREAKDIIGNKDITIQRDKKNKLGTISLNGSRRIGCVNL